MVTTVRWNYLSLGDPIWAPLKKLAFLQFDSLAYGVGLALLEVTRPQLFSRIIVRPWICLPLAMGGMALFSLGLHKGSGVALLEPFLGWYVLALVGYPLAGLLSAGFLLGLWRFEFAWVGSMLAIPIKTLARVSYSVYLLHMGVKDFCVSLGSGLLPFSGYLLLSMLVGWLGWWAFERPFIALRARWR